MNIHPTCIAIGAERIARIFGSKAVLNNLCLAIAEGESVAIIGANGSGKTTLLRCLAGLMRLNGGIINWFGRPAADTPVSRRLVGMVAHDGFLYPHLTARENLVFAARMYEVPNPGHRADSLIKSAGLEPYASRHARKLSRGIRQRLSILRALVHEPKILILDEPFAALDASGADWLCSLLQELRSQGRTLCFTTHDLQFARAHSDRVLELRRGVLEIFDNAPEHEINTHPFTKAA